MKFFIAVIAVFLTGLHLGNSTFDSMDDVIEEDSTNVKKDVKGPQSSVWVAKKCEVRRNETIKKDMGDCMTWSLGLEHESFLVHRKKGNLEEYVVNTGTISTQVSRFGRAFGLSKKNHTISTDMENVGIEFSGRACAGINDINFKAMTESVTIGHKMLSYDSAYCQIQTIDEHIVYVVSSAPGEKREIEELGPISHPRAGMSSELGVYTRTAGKAYKCASCSGCELKDYTGSYHISISLPRDSEGWILYDPDTMTDPDTCNKDWVAPSRKDVYEDKRVEWVDAHANFGNKFQWVEPLIMAVMGSADADSVCDKGAYVEGSYRTMAAGWGVPGTTDLRNVTDFGVGRYTQTGFQWLLDAAPSEDEGVFDCVSEGMGSDIRTKSSIDEHDLRHGESLPPMQVGEGVELRIFDNFPLEHLPSMFYLVTLLAESSRIHVAEEYVYDDEDWSDAAISAMKEGWNAIMPVGYVSKLEKYLDIDLSSLDGNVLAFDVLESVYEALILNHIDGFWTGLLIEESVDIPMLTNPNRESWEGGAINKKVNANRIFKALDSGYGKKVVIADTKTSKVCPSEDFQDLVYLAKTYGLVKKISKNKNGSVKSVRFLKKSKVENKVEYPVCSV